MIFDSGAGGLSIAREILHSASMPLRLSYLADHSAFPYGDKDESFLIAHVSSLIEDFLRQQQPDLVVIACNTASTIVLPELRRRFSCPFVGVVPAIKPAAKLSQSKVIGVLATPATVSREYTNKLIREFAPDCQVRLYGSDTLVRCAENFVRNQQVDPAHIDAELHQLLSQADNMDTIVLACTHFPLLVSTLREAAPQIIHWVDSAKAIARRTFQLLRERYKIKTTVKPQHDIEVFFTTHAPDDSEIENMLESYRRVLTQEEWPPGALPCSHQ